MRVKLMEKRKALGHTQRTMAALLGISRSHYSQIETGEKTPSWDLAMKIKEVTGYKKDDLFYDFKRPNTGLMATKADAKRNLNA